MGKLTAEIFGHMVDGACISANMSFSRLGRSCEIVWL